MKVLLVLFLYNALEPVKEIPVKEEPGIPANPTPLPQSLDDVPSNHWAYNVLSDDITIELLVK